MDDAQFSNVGTEVVCGEMMTPAPELKPATITPINAENDIAIMERIGKDVRQYCSGENKHHLQAANIEYGPLEVNQFSICFRLSLTETDDYRELYVKIPKWDMYKETNRCIMPLTTADKCFAADEYRSLRLMETEWQGAELSVRFAKPVCFLRSYNAIVTERFQGEDFFALYRLWDHHGRGFRKGNGGDPVHAAMQRIGSALGKFHSSGQKPAKFDSSGFIKKIKFYVKKLQQHGCRVNVLNDIESSIASMGEIAIDVFTGNTFKGIDVRNILMNKESGDICMLDPGKIKTNFLEADLARFVLTCRILYWGSYCFLARVSPHPSYEDCFLHAYEKERQKNPFLFSIFLMKEYFKHWLMAHNVIALKRWPLAVRKLVAATYVDPFYRSSIQKELINLGKIQHGLC